MMGRLLTILTVAVLLAGCNAQKKTSDKDVTMIGRVELRKLLNDEKLRDGLVVVDVRDADLYDEAHIPGSINIRVIDLRKSDPRLGEATTLVVYGSGDPNDLLSWAAAKKLVALGYVNVHDFRGGMEEWLGRREVRSPLIDRRMEDKADMY